MVLLLPKTYLVLLTTQTYHVLVDTHRYLVARQPMEATLSLLIILTSAEAKEKINLYLKKLSIVGYIST